MIIGVPGTVNGYRVPPCDTDSVGDWQGQEEQAARQFVLLCEALAEASEPCTQNESDDAFYNQAESVRRQAEYEMICSDLWDIWGSDERLLGLTPEQMAAEGRRRAGTENQ